MITTNMPRDLRPAARATLAAAGPVEPSRLPAPGPTLPKLPRHPSNGHLRARRNEALVRQVRLLHRRGENRQAIARALGIASDTARRWLDPDYQHQRSIRSVMPEEPELPTLPFIPGIVVSGRYRMLEPSA